MLYNKSIYILLLFSVTGLYSKDLDNKSDFKICSYFEKKTLRRKYYYTKKINYKNSEKDKSLIPIALFMSELFFPERLEEIEGKKDFPHSIGLLIGKRMFPKKKTKEELKDLRVRGFLCIE